MIILGAGMSGLLAAQHFRSIAPTVVEKQENLPDNHKALLRFRSNAVSELTGIRFREVGVDKAVWDGNDLKSEATIGDMNSYSYKVTGEIKGRSISNLNRCTRYIAPDGFLELLSSGVDVELGVDCHNLVKMQKENNVEPIISTIPVGSLAEMLGYDMPILRTKGIWIVSATISNPICDIYQTVYIPHGSTSKYRASITGNKLIIEFTEMPLNINDHVNGAIRRIFKIPSPIYGNIEVHYQKYGKLIERDDRAVKNFIKWATKEHNIYSLGRWGTHRQLLMDDVVNDIKVIDNLIHTEGYGK